MSSTPDDLRASSIDESNHNNNDDDEDDDVDNNLRTIPPSDPYYPTGPIVKPALKKTTKPNPKKKKGGLKWDEAKIEEHDKLRGTRMKIDEPNTPYHNNYDSGSETDGSHGHHKDKAICWDVLENRLAGVMAAQVAYPPSSPSSHGGGDSEVLPDDKEEEEEEDEQERRQRDMKAIEFREYRKRHYNEMELVRRFRQEHSDGDGDDDGDDDSDEDNDADDET